MPNYVGDAVMALPAIALLRRAGHALHLLGRPWLAALCAGLPDPVSAYPRGLSARLRLLRAFGDERDIVLFTQSFSSALESRLAGLRGWGYRRDFRGGLLRHALPYDAHEHQAVAYWRLARTLVPGVAGLPPRASLPITTAAAHTVDALLHDARLPGRFVLLCPVAGGLHAARSKNWAGFTALESALHAQGIPTVCAPGPGEEPAAHSMLPHSLVLAQLPLDRFAALCARSTLVVANDSGQGHVAAAAGARLLSLFGVTRPERVRPWSPRADVLGGFGHWPTLEGVLAACRRVLDAVPEPAT